MEVSSVSVWNFFCLSLSLHLGLPAPIKRFASFSPQIFDDSAHTKSSAAGALYPPSAPARHRDKDYAELCTFTAEKEVPINFSCKSRQSTSEKSWLTLIDTIWLLWAMDLAAKPPFWPFLGWVTFSRMSGTGVNPKFHGFLVQKLTQLFFLYLVY